MCSLSSYCNNSRKNILENHVCLCQTQGTSAPGVAGPRSCFPCVPVCESSPAPRLAPVVCWVLPSASCPWEGTPLSFSVPVTAVPAGGSLWCVLSCSALALPQLSSQPWGDNLPLVLLGVTGFGGVRTGLLGTAGELHAQRTGTVGGQVWMPGVLSAAMACCSCSLSPNFSTAEWNVLREFLCLSK